LSFRAKFDSPRILSQTDWRLLYCSACSCFTFIHPLLHPSSLLARAQRLVVSSFVREFLVSSFLARLPFGNANSIVVPIALSLPHFTSLPNEAGPPVPPSTFIPFDMLSSTLTVLSLIFATLAPTPAVAQLNSTLSRRDPRPRPAAQGQHAPSSPKKPSRRRRSIPESSSSSLTSEAALVKKRSKRRVNPKPRRVPLNPKYKKRSEIPQTSYSLAQSSMGGYSFFDNWDWFTWADPTHGAVNYNSEEDSWKNGLVYVPSPARDTTIMRVDSWTNLPYGQLRNSVRISSKQKVDIGSIVIADIR